MDFSIKMNQKERENFTSQFSWAYNFLYKEAVTNGLDYLVHMLVGMVEVMNSRSISKNIKDDYREYALEIKASILAYEAIKNILKEQFRLSTEIYKEIHEESKKKDQEKVKESRIIHEL